ncbi:hypothetical protein [Halobellus litoreus]|jgi:hypothetical protein|uniref:Uncharacterized protein n=1 Tax=Halobellus litoreus TaxID=755310 RepID=A0ABD6DRX5_9EURY|nr:hypothetical protein [Halobellus litoreus]
MDSECPSASRIAGQQTTEFDANFTFTAMQNFKRGNWTLPARDSLGVLGQAHGVDAPGLRPYRRLADGDGR